MPIGIFIIGIPLLILGLYFLIVKVFNIDLTELDGIIHLSVFAIVILLFLALGLYSFFDNEKAIIIFQKIIEATD